MAVTEQSGKPRIVVFGGTFDPIHNGHVEIARCLRDDLGAEKVLMVPAGRPWLRDNPPVASPQDRLRMVELATRDEHGIEVSDVDVVRPGTTYSLDTIQDLRAVYGSECEFILAVGADAARTLHRWHRYDELVKVCSFAVVKRPGTTNGIGTQLPSGTMRVDGPMVDVSASEIRGLYARGDPTVTECVPGLTHRFIIERGLYRCDPTLP